MSKRSWLRAIAVYLGVPIGLWFVISNYLVTVTWMASSSMAPALQAGTGGTDGVLVDRVSLRTRPPRRGEIVLLELDDGIWAFKRVAALPNEVVEIRDGSLLIDSRTLDPATACGRIRYANSGQMGAGRRIRTRPGHYFLLGDDSSDSWDSRYWGAVPVARLAGLGRARFWPPHRAGIL